LLRGLGKDAARQDQDGNQALLAEVHLHRPAEVVPDLALDQLRSEPLARRSRVGLGAPGFRPAQHEARFAAPDLFRLGDGDPATIGAEAVARDIADIVPSADGSATALIHRSKTDQEGGGATLWLSPRAAAHLRRWTALAGITEGAIFRRLSKAGRPGGRLVPSAVPPILKGLAAIAGLDPAAFSGHSARVGMTQDLTASGAELPAIMQAGRWKSPAMPGSGHESALSVRFARTEPEPRRPGARVVRAVA
jgi:hypothetical protein